MISHEMKVNFGTFGLNQNNQYCITFLPLLLKSFQASTKPQKPLEEPVYTTLSGEFTFGCKVLHKADWISTIITSVTQALSPKAESQWFFGDASWGRQLSYHKEIVLPLPAICFTWGFEKFLKSSNFLLACVLSDFAETCNKQEPFSRLLFSQVINP